MFGLATALLSACATYPRTPSGSSAASPFVIERDLAGPSSARGEIKTITGVRRKFTAILHGTFDGKTFTLVEDFVFDDGVKERKTWRLERVEPGRYVGAREDVVGQAIGRQVGPVFHLEYNLRLPSENGRGRVLRFRDVMAKTADGKVLNDATMGWLGLRVGSVSLVIEPAADARTLREDAPLARRAG